jgi:predicted ATPase/DNA-binding SARP family transcriptional activator/tetratricopeptide (TPR) repeat protein
MTPHVHLLGGATAELGSARVDFLPDKRFQFLAVLAYSGTWMSREKLGFLFWPDVTTEHARHNLRQLLRRVQALGWVGSLEVERQRIRWPVSTDVSAVWEALAEGNPAEALKQCRGPLLDGLEGDDASEFGEWLSFERESLHTRLRGALLEQAANLERLNQHREAAQVLAALLERDPLDEAVLQDYLRVMAQTGQPLVALNSYQAFEKRLLHDLGLEPSTPTQQLAQALREAATEATSGASPTQHSPATSGASSHLPHPATSFIGRDAELGEITQLLTSQACRLVTILGPGGIGKTRLSLEVARALSHDYQGNVHFVALGALSSADHIPTTIAEALGVSLQGKDPPIAQISNWIASRATLVALDNFETVMNGAGYLSELLAACPSLKLIVTSRERLNLAEEWLFPIEGMRYASDQPLSVETARSLEAVQLFLARAQQVQPRFKLESETLPHVVKLCRMVEGSPLGIELAATWVRSLPPAEIAEEVEVNLDFLASSSRNIPARHHSLRATFEYSWSLLGPREQQAVRRLSIFAGGFTREAAAVVTDTPSAVLLALHDKSLLRVAQDGRYDSHPLIAHFSREKLAQHPAEHTSIKQKHETYFRHFLDHQAQKLLGLHPREGVAAIAKDLENIRLAWQRALEERRANDLLEAIPTLTFFFDAEVRDLEGIALFERASRAFDEQNPHHHKVLGRLAVAQAWPNLWRGQFVEALHLIQRALPLLHPDRGEWGIWLALRAQGFIAFFTGNFEDASRCWSEELTSLREGGRNHLEAEVLSRLALAHAWKGDLDAASAHLRGALAQKAKLGRYLNLTCLLYGGYAELAMERWPQAWALFSEAQERALALGDVRYLPHLANGLGLSALELGRLADAKTLCQKGLDLAENCNDTLAKCWAKLFLGRVYLALGEPERARGHLEAGLREASDLGSAPTLRYGLCAFAELAAKEGRLEPAARWLGAVRGHAASDQFAQVYAQKVMRELARTEVGLGDSTLGGTTPSPLGDLVREALLSS